MTVAPPSDDASIDVGFPLTKKEESLNPESSVISAPLVSPPSDVENDEGIEALEACDEDDAATLIEVGPLASALL